MNELFHNDFVSSHFVSSKTKKLGLLIKRKI